MLDYREILKDLNIPQSSIDAIYDELNDLACSMFRDCQCEMEGVLLKRLDQENSTVLRYKIMEVSVVVVNQIIADYTQKCFGVFEKYGIDPEGVFDKFHEKLAILENGNIPDTLSKFNFPGINLN